MNKQDFPIFSNHKNLIYFDSAASSQKPQMVLDAINTFYATGYSNVHRGNYTLSEHATDLYEKARIKVAQFINSDPDEIIFTSGTTDSINKLAQSLNKLIRNDAIVTTEMEHHSNFLPWQQLALKNGCDFRIVSVKKDYTLDLDQLYKFVENDEPAVVAITQMSNVLGTINPIKEIVKEIKWILPDTIVVIDAAQSIHHMKVDVKDLGCDALAFSGHKMFGPTGIGVLYVKKELLKKLEPTVYGGGMIKKVERFKTTWEDAPTSFEAGTPNIEGAIGLGAAIDYINSIGFEKIIKYETELSKYFINVIGSIPGVKIFGPTDLAIRGPVFSFAVDKIHPHDLSSLLNEFDIATRAGHHCAQILHREVLKVVATTRASLSIYNEPFEIDKLKEAILKIKEKFKA